MQQFLSQPAPAIFYRLGFSYGGHLSRFQIVGLPDFRYPIWKPNHLQTHLFLTIGNPDTNGYQMYLGVKEEAQDLDSPRL